MPDTPPQDEHNVQRRLAAVFGALADSGPGQDADNDPLADALRQALRHLGDSVGPSAPVGQAEAAPCAVLVTAVPSSAPSNRYDVTLTVAWQTAAPDALTGAVLSLAMGHQTYWLARLKDTGDAQWAGVPTGPWQFGLVSAAPVGAGAARYPLPVERASLAPAAKQHEEPRVIRFPDVGAEVSIHPADRGEPQGPRVDLRVLETGTGPIAYPLHYQELGGAAAIVLVPIENRPYRTRASVTLPALDTSAPWALGDPVGPDGIQSYPPEVIRASLRAVGDNLETADAWRAVAELTGGTVAELVADTL